MRPGPDPQDLIELSAGAASLLAELERGKKINPALLDLGLIIKLVHAYINANNDALAWKEYALKLKRVLVAIGENPYGGNQVYDMATDAEAIQTPDDDK